MTDGASAASQDIHTHRISIKTWSRTVPPTTSSGSQLLDQPGLLEQYTRFVASLESRTGVLKHVYVPLKISKATTERDFRWLSHASKLSNSDIAKYTLSHRSQFIRESEDLEGVYELDFLEDFHSVSVSAERSLPPSSSNAVKANVKPFHVYGRKSTARPSLPSQAILPPVRPLRAFRNLLESASSQDTKDESIQSSTPQISRKKKRMIIDSPATSSALEHSSDASPTSSPSPSPSPPTVSSRRPAVYQETRPENVPTELRGRQPLRLQAVTSVVAAEPTKNSKLPLQGKPKPALRPITRKIPVKGIPVEKAVLVHKSLGSVISHARRLQSLGGSWPLKRQRVGVGDVTDEDAAEVLPEEVTEIIEDYTIQAQDISSASTTNKGEVNDTLSPVPQDTFVLPAALAQLEPVQDPATMLMEDVPPDIAAEPTHDSPHVPTSAGRALPLFVSPTPPEYVPEGGVSIAYKAAEAHPVSVADVLQSTNLQRPPSPPTPLSKPRQRTPSQMEVDPGPRENPDASYANNADVSYPIPDISVTLATSPLRTQSQGTQRLAAVGSVKQQGHLRSKQSNTSSIPLSTFLSLAFDSGGDQFDRAYFRQILPTRCIPKFRNLLKPISPSPIRACFVPEERLHRGGMFGDGYLGPGRRGFWELPLQGKCISEHATSRGVILGLAEEPSGTAAHSSGTVFWTLPRLRCLLGRLQDIASLGRFGVVTICTTAMPSDDARISLEISCQSSMARMLRTIFDEIACPLDGNGDEVALDADTAKEVAVEKRLGERWLDSRSGVSLVWWDEIERLPILAA